MLASGIVGPMIPPGTPGSRDPSSLGETGKALNGCVVKLRSLLGRRSPAERRGLLLGPTIKVSLANPGVPAARGVRSVSLNSHHRRVLRIPGNSLPGTSHSEITEKVRLD